MRQGLPCPLPPSPLPSLLPRGRSRAGSEARPVHEALRHSLGKRGRSLGLGPALGQPRGTAEGGERRAQDKEGVTELAGGLVCTIEAVLQYVD